MASEEEVDRTLRESERILSQFEELRQEYEQKRAESEELARKLGATNFEHLVQAATRNMSPAEKEMMEKEQAAFKLELERELREIEERAKQEKPTAVSPTMARARRFGRTV